VCCFMSANSFKASRMILFVVLSFSIGLCLENNLYSCLHDLVHPVCSLSRAGGLLYVETYQIFNIICSSFTNSLLLQVVFRVN